MSDHIDLSIIVVSYDISRELPRTLLSLARPYQRLSPEIAYEVIVVDNHSPRPPQVSDFADLDLNLRIVTSQTISRSPVFALNQGLDMARGALVGAWIDGARLASPGLLAAVHAAAGDVVNPVLAPLNWQIGPHRQHLSAARKYDQTTEDALLSDINWPADGYALFDASTCETIPHPTGPLLESNALFLRRQVWTQLNGFDQAFDEPGGGVANPDMLLRACDLSDARLIRIADEGTFHQFHGGLTTSETGAAASELQRGSRKYFTLRGKTLRQIRDHDTIYWHRNQTNEDRSHAHSA